MATGVVIHARPVGLANLHQTRLNREQLIEVIACGRPGTEKPYFDKYAYEDTNCYGLGGKDWAPMASSGASSCTIPDPRYSAVRSGDKPTAAELGRLRGEMDAIEQAPAVSTRPSG
jgi:hypothetical protein